MRTYSSAIGTTPKAPPVGSSITAAMSFRDPSRVRVPSRSSEEASRTLPAISSSSPGVALPSKWSSTPKAAWSCQPWKWPLRRTSFFFPVQARARRSAIRLASVPDDVNRTRSAHGTSCLTSVPQRTSRSWHAAGCVPSSS